MAASAAADPDGLAGDGRAWRMDGRWLICIWVATIVSVSSVGATPIRYPGKGRQCMQRAPVDIH